MAILGTPLECKPGKKEKKTTPHRCHQRPFNACFCHLLYLVATKTSIRWPRMSPVRGGLLFSSQACTPKMSPGISAGSPKNAQHRPKALKTTKKTRFFHKKRKSPLVHASTRGKVVFFGFARHSAFKKALFFRMTLISKEIFQK